MARRGYNVAPDPLRELYKQLVIRRMQAKEELARRKAIEAAINAPPPGPGVPPLEEGSWSALPGARNANVPFVMGEGGQHGYDELYAGSPYADQGRNWSSPEQWARYNDSSRIPDWLRTPGSGLGPAFEPSPELQTLREQVRTLRGMAPTRADIIGRANFHDQLARAVAMADEDLQWEQAWADARGDKPVAPGIANIWGPWDEPRSMIKEAYPENPTPGIVSPDTTNYKWGAQEVAPDKGYIVSDPITRSGVFPKQFSATPAGRQRAATALDFAQPLEYQRGAIPKGTKGAIGVESRRPYFPAGSMPTGEDPELQTEPVPGPWSEVNNVPQGPPRPQMPEPGTLWDNYEPEFVAAMHSGDENEINKVKDSIRLFGW